MRTIQATEYVTPLREGGSLPAIVEGDDDGTWVLKFRGAGQGLKALIAELISGEIGRVLGLPVPEIVLAHLDGRFGKTEPDPEIQELLRASEGLNLAIDYLPGSITFDPLVPQPVADNPTLASSIVWFDALAGNVDRTAKNTNLLVWHRKLWMIDHGATLIFHHNWADDPLARSRAPYRQASQHVLLRWASEMIEVDAELASRLTPATIDSILTMIPDEWLNEPEFSSAAEHRNAYRDYLVRRLEAPRTWVEDLVRVRTSLV